MQPASLERTCSEEACFFAEYSTKVYIHIPCIDPFLIFIYFYIYIQVIFLIQTKCYLDFLELRVKDGFTFQPKSIISDRNLNFKILKCFTNFMQSLSMRISISSLCLRSGPFLKLQKERLKPFVALRSVVELA